MTTRQPSQQPLPLNGLRVLDATHIVAGPFCSMILADMGAEVIKVERPKSGDRARHNHPFVTSEDGQKVSARFLGVNRNKKSVTLDIRDPRGQRAFGNLVRVSDVLLDNWGPGAMARLGYGYDHLREINPGLVYATITGFGDSDGLRGPYSQWPANNPCVQAMGGWMEITGAPDGPPQMVGDNIGDSVPGVWTALGVMMALEGRRKTGLGQHVDMAMYDCMVAHTTSSMPHYQATGEVTSRARENMFTAQLAVKAKDGYAVLAGAGTADKWAALWRHIGREDLVSDTRYLGQGVTGEFYFNYVVPAIEEWSQHQLKLDIAQQLIKLGYSMGVVQNTAEIDQCPHLEARKMFVTMSDGIGGTFRAANTPIRLTESPDTPTGTPPSLGEHNAEILCGIGGLTTAELAQMERDGVV
ncbi:MAG: CoA transferase [Dehalococcoidia bacterium]|nr:CoA transferase [Dehalococcoidia bacterium]MSQ16106.1 CoA transferase [Dehalococcoidia bacterium]